MNIVMRPGLLVCGLAGLALWSVPARAQQVASEPIDPQVAAGRVAECGLGPASVGFDELMQSHVLTLGRAGAATDAQLACVDQAAGFHLVALPGELQARFDAIRGARWSAQGLAIARAWLSERGLLARVPEYVPGKTDDAAFIREIEALCGPDAKGAFHSRNGELVIDPEWMVRAGDLPSDGRAQAFACLLHVTVVTGYRMGFIGNEQFAEPRKADD